MNKITLSQADFDALPLHQTPPPREVCDVWKTGVGRLWFRCERKYSSGFVEIVISEIVIEETEAAQ